MGALFGFAQQGYTLRADMQAPDGAVFYLKYTYADADAVDSASVSHNQFTFKGSLPQPVICTLTNNQNKQMRIFIAQNSAMTIFGTLNKLFDAKIDGSAENNWYNSFRDKKMELGGIFRKAIAAAGINAHDAKGSEALIAYQKSLDSLTTAFVTQHAGTTAATLAIMDSYVTIPDKSKAGLCYNLLLPAAQANYYGQQILQFVSSARDIAVGKPAPDFSLKDDKGHVFTLSSLHGRYILLDFWASWCGPCRAENPNLKKCYQQYQSKNIVWVSVSMDADAAAWKRAVQADGLTWLQLNDPKSVSGQPAALYGVKAIPFNCVINPQGIIVATNLRGQQLPNFLAKLF